MKVGEKLRQTYNIIFKEESLRGYVAFAIFTYVLLKFAVFPLLSCILGSKYPVTVIVTNSMNHFSKDIAFTFYGYYILQGYNLDAITSFPFPSGLLPGDIIIAVRPEDIRVGDIVLYVPPGAKHPIAHRIARINSTCIITKGDANYYEDPFCLSKRDIVGKVVFRIPLLGYPKVLLLDLIHLLLGAPLSPYH